LLVNFEFQIRFLDGLHYEWVLDEKNPPIGGYRYILNGIYQMI